LLLSLTLVIKPYVGFSSDMGDDFLAGNNAAGARLLPVTT
jgi:hypothetical protein